MANPIPLTSPDGLLRAWMCGSCESIHSGIELPWPASDEKRERQAEHYQEYAERCCVCMGCRAAPVVYANYCTRCHERHRWDLFARSWGWIADAIAAGFTPDEQGRKAWSRSEFE